MGYIKKRRSEEWKIYKDSKIELEKLSKEEKERLLSFANNQIWYRFYFYTLISFLIPFTIYMFTYKIDLSWIVIAVYGFIMGVLVYLRDKGKTDEMKIVNQYRKEKKLTTFKWI